MTPTPHDSHSQGFLTDLPPELDALLRWFRAGSQPEDLSASTLEYAGSLLCGLIDDQAMIPPPYENAPHLLALVLTHHIRNPDHCGAWLNLGFGLRRLAISDSDAVKALRLERALGCFDRALALSREHRAVAVRAWAGKALAFRQLERFDEATRSALEARNLDSSDPNLWLLCSYCQTFAGKDDEAAESVQRAYKTPTSPRVVPRVCGTFLKTRRLCRRCTEFDAATEFHAYDRDAPRSEFAPLRPIGRLRRPGLAPCSSEERHFIGATTETVSEQET